MKLTLLFDKILVKRKEKDTVTAGGIIIPLSSVEKSDECEVVAVGQGILTNIGKIIPFEVKVGDKLLLSKNCGTDITIDGIEYLMLRESEVLAIIE